MPALVATRQATRCEEFYVSDLPERRTKNGKKKKKDVPLAYKQQNKTPPPNINFKSWGKWLAHLPG